MQSVWGIVRRNFSVGDVRQKMRPGSYSRFLGKMLRRNNDSANPFELPVLRPGITRFARPHQTQRRIAAMTKVMSGHITDLLSTGSVAPELMQSSIQIYDIEVAANLNVVRVYWAHDNMYSDPELEKIVLKAGHQLRDELSRMNIVGNMPPVVFVKHKYAFIEKDVECRFEAADYGEDFQPQTYKSAVTEIVTAADESEEADTEKTKGAKANKEDPVGFFVNLPAMRHDVLGLDHYKIMTKIQASLEKSQKAVERRKISDSLAPPKDVDMQALIRQQEEQQQKFLEYLRTAERSKRMRLKNLKKSRLDKELSGVYSDDEDDLEEYPEPQREVYFEDDIEEDYEDDIEDRYK